jgi:hypothetical protein
MTPMKEAVYDTLHPSSIECLDIKKMKQWKKKKQGDSMR